MLAIDTMHSNSIEEKSFINGLKELQKEITPDVGFDCDKTEGNRSASAPLYDVLDTYYWLRWQDPSQCHNTQYQVVFNIFH